MAAGECVIGPEQSSITNDVVVIITEALLASPKVFSESSPIGRISNGNNIMGATTQL